jgi:tetratricopeptide (TPR) repeat protein
VNQYLLLVLTALLYALAFGALTWLRGEGLVARFAWEVLAVTAAIVAVAWVARLSVHPVLLLVAIYLVTMRARLLVDVGNALSGRKRHEDALAVLRLGLRLASDPFTASLVRINIGVTQIRQKRFEDAISQLDTTLANLPQGRGSPKYEAACRYNLGLAYLRTGQEANGSQQMRQVVELLPNSIYAVGAEAALKKLSH